MLSGVELLADFNPTSNWESIREFKTVGETAFFTFDDRVHGIALWRTDGTPHNTVLVKDLRPDRMDPQLYYLTPSGNQLFFIAAADVPNRGYQLWKSDGTENGTQPIWHADSSEYWNAPFDLVSTSGGLFFLVIGEGPGQEFVYELWRSDGTAEGTIYVKDVQPFLDRARPRLFGEVNGNLLFQADDGVHGKELWTSDGTPEGTALLVDMAAGGESGFADNSYSEYLVANQRLYFVADADADAPTLWSTDGTVEGTFPLGQFSGLLTQFTALADLMLFSARNELTGRWELWRTTGTPKGTVSISIETEFQGFEPLDLIAAGGAVYFNAFDAAHGQELWRTDGTAAGTGLLADLRPGLESSWPKQFVATDEFLFLVGQREANVPDLWRVRLTTLDISLVYEADSEARPQVDSAVGAVDNRLFFTLGLPNYGGMAAFTDGTAVGTLYFDLNQTTQSSFLNLSVLVDKSIYGYALDYNKRTLTLHRVELATGTYTHVLNHEFEPRLSVPEMHHFGLVNGVLTFLISWNRIVEVWTYNSIDNALQMEVALPTPATISSGCVSIGYGVPFEDVLLFVAQGATGCELWRTSTTSEGTFRLADSFAIGNSQTSSGVALSNQRLFFTARDPDSPNEFELWTTDATLEGTLPFDDFLGIQASIRSPYALRIDDRWYFVGEDELTGRELWTSDGTQQGTHLVADINPGPADSVGYLRSVAASKLFFVADDGVHGLELWVSDGTSVGTAMLVETVSGQNTTLWPDTLFHGVFEDAFLYTAPGSNLRRQLWRTDGTEAGTVQLSDLPRNNTGSALPRIATPSNFVNVNGTLFFTASTEGTSNDELWISDGTPAGTRLYHDFDILDGPCRDFLHWPCWPVVEGLQAVNGELFLLANDRIYGREPFIVRRSPGDTNFDSVIDLADLNIVRSNFGRAGANLPGDLTQDGRVDLLDLNEVRNHFSSVELPRETASARAAEQHISLTAHRHATDLLFRRLDDHLEKPGLHRDRMRSRPRQAYAGPSEKAVNASWQ